MRSAKERNKGAGNDEIKVQTVAIGKAAQLFKLIKSKSKSSAITASILLLARNRRLREIFFSDLDEVKRILKNGDDAESEASEANVDAKAEQEDGWK